MGELRKVARKVSKLADVGGRDKAGPDHVAREQVANPLGILTVGLVSLLRLGVLTTVFLLFSNHPLRINGKGITEATNGLAQTTGKITLDILLNL